MTISNWFLRIPICIVIDLAIRTIVNRKRFEHFYSKCSHSYYIIYHKLPVTLYTQLPTWVVQ